jgi:TolB-like protein/tetratricopeptide (TPR) repeat protein
MVDSAYAFAGAAFDPVSGALTLGGHSARLRPRTAAVLRCLLDHAGELVSKDHLLKEVWADLVVTENSLAQCVKEIRRALSDSGETVLKTIPKRGYLLDAPVERTGKPVEFPRRPRAIIVMPLANLDGDPDQDYFAEALSEDLTNDIGQVPTFTVIARGTAQAYAQRAVDVRDVGRDLGVAYAIEGSVRRAEERVVVSLSIADTRDARQLWRERFEGKTTELAVLQRVMAACVTRWLCTELPASDSGASLANADAHDLAMRAWSLQYRAAPGVSREAHRLLLRALELDPRSAFAWSGVAHIHISDLATRHTEDWDDSIARADEAATRAVELDPHMTRALLSLGQVRSYQGRFEESLDVLDRTMALNANMPHVYQWQGIDHMLMGNAHLAIRPLEMCIELSPRDRRLSTLTRNLALAYLHLGEDEKALHLGERSIHQHPVWPRSYETLAAAYAVSKLLDDARAAVEVLLRHWPGYSIAQHRAEMMSNRPGFLAQRERLLDGLGSAGLPER